MSPTSDDERSVNESPPPAETEEPVAPVPAEEGAVEGVPPPNEPVQAEEPVQVDEPVPPLPTEPLPAVPGPPEPPPRAWHRGLPLGRVVLAVLLIAAGVLWLLDVANVVNVSAGVLLPCLLMAIGLTLVLGARTGRHGGLIVLGVILTVILAFTSSFDIRLEGGVGQRTERPRTMAQLERTYRLSTGQLTLRLDRLQFPNRNTRITASVGLGQLVVEVPPTLVVSVHAKVGAGDFTFFGRDHSGVDIDRTDVRTDGLGSDGQLTLNLSVGLGQITVRGPE